MGFIKTGFKGLSLSHKNNFLQCKSLKQTNKQKEKTKKGKTQQRKIKEEKKTKHTLQKHLTQRSHGTGYSV